MSLARTRLINLLLCSLVKRSKSFPLIFVIQLNYIQLRRQVEIKREQAWKRTLTAPQAPLPGPQPFAVLVSAGGA